MKAGFVCLIMMFSASLGCGDKSAKLEDSGVNAVRNLDQHPKLVENAKTKEQREKLRAIIIDDGISKEEAQVIAESYFVLVGCGALSGVRNGEGVWFVEGQFGDAGDPINNFTISKRTGEVKSSIGPSYKEPRYILIGMNESN
jgi:hypothetical protein